MATDPGIILRINAALQGEKPKQIVINTLLLEGLANVFQAQEEMLAAIREGFAKADEQRSQIADHLDDHVVRETAVQKETESTVKQVGDDCTSALKAIHARLDQLESIVFFPLKKPKHFLGAVAIAGAVLFVLHALSNLVTAELIVFWSEKIIKLLLP